MILLLTTRNCSDSLPGSVADMEPVRPVQIWPRKSDISNILIDKLDQPDDQPKVLPEEGQLHGEGQVAMDIVQLQVPCDHWVHIHCGHLEGKK